MLSRFSHSALSSFRSCPRKFKFQYIERPTVPKRVTPDTYLGQVVHRILSNLYNLGADGIVLPLEEAIAQYEQDWSKLNPSTITSISEQYTVDDYIRLGREMLTRHYQRYQPFNQNTLLGTELRLTFQLPETPFKLLAIIDRLTKLEDGTVQICDYKTGKRPSMPSAPAFRYQMGIYQLAVQSSWPDYQSIELVQHFLRQDEVIRHRMSPEDVDLLGEDLRTQILDIHRAEKLDDFHPQESGLCNYCEYIELCPAKRHRLLLEGQDVDEISDLPPEKRAWDLSSQYIEVSQNYGEAKALRESLKADIVDLARESGFTSMEGNGGRVNISLVRKEKLVTKSEDRKAFADLSFLARELGLEDYFVLDGRALMKEIVQKQRLSAEGLEQLSKFVAEKEESRVTVKLEQTDDSED
jgi:putative RecB family exonuclease